MRLRSLRWPALIVLLAVCGCGRGRGPDTEEKPAVAPRTPSVRFGGSVIRIEDPKGRWTFEARSASVIAQSSEGPFSLSPADAIYQEKGQQPVHMSAKSADVQKQAGRVILQGSVVITFDNWRLDADRVSYDLNTGKVVSPGHTKVTYLPEGAQQSRPPGGGGAH
jgi:hypothetical protein